MQGARVNDPYKFLRITAFLSQVSVLVVVLTPLVKVCDFVLTFWK
jgi:hypothetical protein